MNMDRRDFFRRSGQAAAMGCLLPFVCPEFPYLVSEPPKQLKVLILGGTGFLGPAVVKALKARGHEITLFNRGRTQPHLFPELEKLHGDRNKDLSALEGRRWDAVIDNCGYHPRQLRKSTAMLKDSGFYLFVSTVSVYRDIQGQDLDESSALGTIENPEDQKVTNASYGPLKVLCEQVASKAFPKKSVIVRPGLIVGPGDPTDRFTYWPVRVARGGNILAPGKPEWGVQYIDVRDLASWMVLLCEKQTTGTYNALGPVKPTAFGDLLNACKSAAKSDATFCWMTQEFMKDNSIVPWKDMPVYSNPSGKLARPALISNKLAIKSGLTFRSLDDTVKATLTFHESRGPYYQMRGGLPADRERAALKIWHDHQKKAKSKK